MPVASVRPDLIDDNDHAANRHFYRTAEQFFQDVHHYDSYDRRVPRSSSASGPPAKAPPPPTSTPPWATPPG